MSRTRIELEYPYTDDWDSGYIFKNIDDRNMIRLHNEGTNNATITSYARYLLAVHLKRYLLPSEHVDHIDNDKHNDSINNLQILSHGENNRKQARLVGRKMVLYVCPICKIHFSIRHKLSNMLPCNEGKIHSCSRTCTNILKSKYSHIMNNKEYYELKLLISKEQVVKTYMDHEIPDIGK